MTDRGEVLVNTKRTQVDMAINGCPTLNRPEPSNRQRGSMTDRIPKVEDLLKRRRIYVDVERICDEEYLDAIQAHEDRISTVAALKGLDINLYCSNGVFDKGIGSWCFLEDLNSENRVKGTSV